MSITSAAPCFEQLRKALFNERYSGWVPLYEWSADREIMEAVLGRPLPPPSLDASGRGDNYYDLLISFYYQMGYDYVPVPVNCYQEPIETGIAWKTAADTAQLSRGERSWASMTEGPVTSREAYNRYPWPDPERVQLGALEFVAERLPPGMKIIATTGCIMENVMESIVGLVPLSTMLYEEPALVRDISTRLGEGAAAAAGAAAGREAVGAVACADDMGHKSGTILSPRHLREFVLPWHRKLVEAAHAHGKPVILHCCGKLDEIMDDIIDYCGYDAKHSFEDVHTPVIEAKERWGDRIAILGGIDMDVIARRSEEYVRQYVRNILEKCAGKGYALGTGNTVANYIPLENYSAMLDEGRKFIVP